jgi:KDO2-lipid IV(A) lauroyltransferase
LAQDPFPISRYLAPRFWPTWLGLGLLRAITWLPWGLQLAVGKFIGYTLWLLPLPARRITRINIELCFPELAKREQARMVRRAFVSLGISLVEMANSFWAHKKSLRERYTIDGLEHLQTALARGKGVILLSAHFTTLELGGRLLSLTTPFHVMYRDLKNPLFDAIVLRARRRNFRSAIHRNDIRQLIRALKENDIVWYAPDQNYGGKSHVFAPFFGIDAATNPATSRLAGMTGAAVVPFYQVRSGGNYQLHFLPAIELDGKQPQQDTARINAILEAMVRQAPGQYLWMHRRFKNRPEGEQRYY